MGEVPLHGQRDRRQDTRRNRLRQCRRGGLPAGSRARDAGAGLRSLRLRGSGAGPRRRQGGPGGPLRRSRLHHAPHAADRADARHDRRGRNLPDEARCAPRQLRARRARRRGGPQRRTRQRPCGGRGLRCLRGRAGGRERALRPRQCRSNPACRGVHGRSAGECGGRGGPADRGLPQYGRRRQRPERAVRHRRRGAEAEALYGPGGRARPFCRTDLRRRDHRHRHRLEG